MKICDLFKEKKLVFSLEVFPPKKTSGIETVYKALDGLADLKPDFISVTYGAGGTGSGSLTVKLASEIKTRYGIEPLAHLTALHSTREQIDEILKELKENGIENILALRGDRHADLPLPEDFRHGSDLALYIKQTGLFDLCGACYPEGHPDSQSLTQDVKNLRYKVRAGCTHLISQLFFDNDDFYAFQDKLDLCSIDVPVEAGIMPIVNKKQIERTVSMCGASIPRKFSQMFSRYENDPDAFFDAGIAYATDQIIDLISNGVAGIHLYTMNNPEVAARIWENIRSIVEAARR